MSDHMAAVMDLLADAAHDIHTATVLADRLTDVPVLFIRQSIAHARSMLHRAEAHLDLHVKEQNS